MKQYAMKPHTNTHTNTKLVYLVVFTAFGGTDDVLLRDEIFKVTCSDLPSSYVKHQYEENSRQ